MTPVRRSSIGDLAGIAFAAAICASFFFVTPAEAEPVNSAPVIDEVMATATTVFETEQCTFLCVATDADGDELQYVWSATEGDLAADGPAARWTAPARNGTASIMVQVSDGRGGIAIEPVLITVLENLPPAVAEVVCEPSTLLPQQTCGVVCFATDPDGHEMTYSWESPMGEISGEGHTIEWTAPNLPGSFPVFVSVEDGHGSDVVSSVIIEVLPSTPPTIHELIVRPFAPEYSKQYDWGYRLLRGSYCECELECVADADGKDLTYVWTCTDGSIVGSGSEVLFIPPHTRTDTTVTVVVDDGFGNAASSEIAFRVLTREGYSKEPDEVPGGCQCGR